VRAWQPLARRGQRDPKSGTRGSSAENDQLAVMRLNRPLCDRQSEAATARIPGSGRIDAVKPIEDPIPVVIGDPWTVIDDVDLGSGGGPTLNTTSPTLRIAVSGVRSAGRAGRGSNVPTPTTSASHCDGAPHA
jgi:hypothetical protein